MAEMGTHKNEARCLRRCWWRAAVMAVAVVAFGCGQGSEQSVLVAGAATEGAEDAQPTAEATPTAPVLSATALPSVGNSQESGGEVPAPGELPGPDGPSGPVGGTGGPSEGGAGVVPGEGDEPGGLRLLAPPPPYLGVANEIYDLCDDQDAYTVVMGQTLGPDEQLTSDDLDAIAFKRRVGEVSCSEPGGRRYVYMSDVGPGGAFATVEGAIEDYKERTPYYEVNKIKYPKDIPLGYYGALRWSFPLEDVDRVVLLEDSVLVLDGTIRGLVHNLSKTMFAREVTVTARPPSGDSDVQPATGRFPLTVQPGERAFFEIEGWTGSDDPALIELSVAAKLSDRVDITRAFSFGAGGSVTTRAVPEEFFKDFVPGFVYEHEKHKIDDDGRLMLEYLTVSLTAPTSHPSLKDQVLNQTIKDLRLYMALTGAGKVYDVIEPPLYREFGNDWSHPHFFPQVVSQPTIFDGRTFYHFNLTFIPEYSWHIWVGEPGPLDYNPRPQPAPYEPPPPTPPPVPPTIYPVE